MRVLLVILFVAAGLCAQTAPCRADEDRHNGTALCVDLKVVDGRVATAAIVFAPTKKFGIDRAAGDDLATEASRAV